MSPPVLFSDDTPGRSRALSGHGAACDEFDDIVGEAGIEEVLEGPRELRALQVTLGEGDAIFGVQYVGDLRPDAELHILTFGPGLKLEERMLVFGELLIHDFKRRHSWCPS